MVLQSVNLWSRMTLLENVIEVPTRVFGIKKATAVDEAMRLLGRVPAASGNWAGWEPDLIEAVCAEAKYDCELVPMIWEGVIPASASIGAGSN